MESAQALRIPYAVVLLEVFSNWGPSSTCLYQVGIHGFGNARFDLYMVSTTSHLANLIYTTKRFTRVQDTRRAH